jgi:acetyl esterase/lipase
MPKVSRFRLLLYAGIAATSTILLLAAVRRRMQQPHTVTYAEIGGQPLNMDVYGAQPDAAKPGLIWVHGGGWAQGSRRDMGNTANYFAGRGYTCFSVDYRLVTADQNKYPTQLDDVQRAVRWIRAHADEYGVDPDRLGAVGQSAGGHLVTLLGTRDTRVNDDPDLADYSSRVQCVVDICGPMDLIAIGQSDSAPSRPIIENLIGAPVQSVPRKYRDASPIAYVDKNSAPFLIIHGGKDPLVPVSQSKILHAALRKHGVESKLVIFPSEGHDAVSSKTADQFFREISRFLDGHLHPEDSQ